MQATADQLHATLKKYFGFDSFRPLQEEIMHDALADRDVFAVLPTGGGKSLCFQLPRAPCRPGEPPLTATAPDRSASGNPPPPDPGRAGRPTGWPDW